MALVTLEEYQTVIRQELDATNLAVVEFSLEAASADVRDALCQQVTVVVDDLIVMHGTGTKALILPECPVIAINEVTVDGTEIETYTVDYENGILFRVGWGCIWNVGFHSITVDYDHGYGTVELDSQGGKHVEDVVPFNIKRAVIELAKIGYHQGSRTPGVSSEITGPFAITYSGNTNDPEQANKILGTLQRRQVRKVPVA